jgi:hypothetical protein
MRLQLTAKASRRHAAELGERLCFRFHLGPLEVSCFAAVPNSADKEADVLVRITLKNRVIIDMDARPEKWLVDDEDCARLEHGDIERVPLGPLLLYVEEGEMRVTLRRRTLIDPRYKHVETWKTLKTT